ncbi:hypothetical protein OIU76_006407 [Salix suchowensis]|nr:hypothetical protein OIU76_006407 [Salix suchowensis]
MVEDFLATLITEGLKRVISITAEGIRPAWGLEDQRRRLHKSLEEIQKELRAVTGESVTDWLVRLQNVADDAEDVLDEFAYENLRKDQKKGKLRDFFSLHNPVAFSLRMGQKVKKINEALDVLREDAGFGSTSRQHEDKAHEDCSDPNPETDCFLGGLKVVGRDDDVSIVTDMLTSLTNRQLVPVVSIVGMAGLGKTTVAKKVYKVVEERKHFDKTIWVSVSNNFCKKRILKEMLQGVDGTTSGLSNLNAIMKKLEKILKKKTFFLVLDDVWNVDNRKLDDLKEQLLKIIKKKGNAVVVTTRSNQVADMMETSPGTMEEQQ